jgi:hypothetical protein
VPRDTYAEYCRQHGIPVREPLAVLDWRDSSHSSKVRKPCRCCGEPAWSLDDDGRHCHKTCAEREFVEGRAMTQESASWKDNREMRQLRERLNNERIENAKPRPAAPIVVEPW